MIPHHSPCFSIIVHHGPHEPTTKLVGALLKNSRVPDRIIVIDHGHPEPLLTLPQTSERLSIIRPTDNQGYGAGIMIALGVLLKSSTNPSKDLILCLNNDASIGDNTIERLCSWWADQPPNTLAGIRFGHVNLLTGRAHLTPTPPRPSLPYLHGAALVGSITDLTRYLPTEYFLYSEDVALSWRAARQGVRLRELPTTLGLTHNDAPAPLSDKKLYYLVRNGARVLEREAPAPWKQYWYLANTARRLYHQILGHKTITRALKDARV